MKKVVLLVVSVVAYLGFMALVFLAQAIVAFKVRESEARLEGLMNAVVIAVLVLMPLVIMQFRRKPHMRIYGKLSALAVLGAIAYQWIGLIGVEYHFIDINTARGLLVIGMILFGGALLFGLFATRIRALSFLARI
jgi:hypothetical protein